MWSVCMLRLCIGRVHHTPAGKLFAMQLGGHRETNRFPSSQSHYGALGLIGRQANQKIIWLKKSIGSSRPESLGRWKARRRDQNKAGTKLHWLTSDASVRTECDIGMRSRSAAVASRGLGDCVLLIGVAENTRRMGVPGHRSAERTSGLRSRGLPKKPSPAGNNSKEITEASLASPRRPPSVRWSRVRNPHWEGQT